MRTPQSVARGWGHLEFQEVVGREGRVDREQIVFVDDMEDHMVGDGRVDGGGHANQVFVRPQRTTVVRPPRQTRKERVMQNRIHEILEDSMRRRRSYKET